MMRPRGGGEWDGIQILLSKDNPCGAPCSNETITSGSRGSRVLFPSCPTLTICRKTAVVQNKPEGELEPGAKSYRAGRPVWISFGHRATLWSSHVVVARRLGSASCSSSRTVFYEGAKAWACHHVHMAGAVGSLERLDLDGIWCSAQRLCSPAPSPLALPLGCLSCLVDAQTAAPSPCANSARWASPWCHRNGMGMEACEAHGSNPR